MLEPIDQKRKLRGNKTQLAAQRFKVSL